MQRNLFILLTAMFMGIIYDKYLTKDWNYQFIRIGDNFI